MPQKDIKNTEKLKKHEHVQNEIYIVRAYLQSIGYCLENAEQVAPNVLRCLEEGDFLEDRDTIQALEEMFLTKAKQLIVNDKLEDAEKLALFKVYFILNKTALKYDFVSDLVREDFLLENFNLENIPEYRISQMKPQGVTSVFSLKNVFNILRN